MSDLVDFASTFPDNTANKVVRDKDLLRLKLVLLRRILLRGRGRVVHVGVRVPGDIGGGHPCGSACIARRSVARVRK